MTTRSALFRLLFWTLLGTASVVGALSFYQFRSALQSEIAGNLRFGASTVMQRIDTFLFSHVENMRVWRGLEVMQDIRVNDVDKRLSHFLSDLRAGQDAVYQALLCTDNTGRVVAASDPSLIGQRAPQPTAWQTIPGQRLDRVAFAPADTARGRVAALRTAVPNAFGTGTIGYLYVLLDWRALQGLLDEAVDHGPRGLLLIDRDGRVIGASAALRERPGTARLHLQQWPLPTRGATSYVHDGHDLGYRTLLVGAAASAGYQQFAGLGWRIIMLEPTSVSFGPIWHLLWAMLAVVLVTLAAGLSISSRLANRIALPIVALTDFTRRFRQGEPAPPTMPATTISEVEELHRAYVDMIRALEQSREQIVRAGKLAVVGEMAAIMAHEVRTPMGILRSSAQLLQRQPDLGERERELIGFIFSETERLNRLVTLLLECARPTPPDFRPHDLHAIVDAVISLLASRAEMAEVALSSRVGKGELVFNCDREQFMQVFLNLVLNALSFVGRGGRVEISARRDLDALRISVADDGPGVPEEMRRSIFDPFFSRREGGIGLGLTIVQQIVQVHGGDITVGESAWGGASFNLRFDTRGREQ
ncbi:sensor histidine kinase [Dyella soli]|uniref:histidine kinase n=1 Tax=Dyella soli TaxID=522319 RepID=A0A4V2NLG8_9GAMM|nr:sensor histidine kinase [Dyella soli]TCI08823.1 HAMP domain-containing histidine kinase [Dyella soli]